MLSVGFRSSPTGPKKPIFMSAVVVFGINWSFHLQMVVSFTEFFLNESAQVFVRDLTQSFLKKKYLLFVLTMIFTSGASL